MTKLTDLKSKNPPKMLSGEFIDIFFNGSEREQDLAIKALYKDCLQNVYKQAHNMGLTKEDAEDAIQDSLVILIRKIYDDKFEDRGYQVSSYFLSITDFRLKSRARLFDVSKRSSSEFEPESDDYDKVLRNENVELISRMLEKLRPQCQKIIELFYFSRMDHESIAERLGYTPGAVKVAKYRCIQTLRGFI
jgi:RNA polymerase sigma factor (sigma-70 family)